MLSTLVRFAVAPLQSTETSLVGRPWWRPQPAFTAKHVIDFRVGRLRVKTVANEAELKEVLALRHAVFHKEFAGRRWALGNDRSPIDQLADHLTIYDEEAGRVAGVYRLLPSRVTQDFYSSSEFDLSGFLSVPGLKLELSRACIHKDYRRGAVISLLWRGVAEYARLTGSDYLFGLSSVPSTDHAKIRRLHQGLVAAGAVDLSWGITPQDGWESPLDGESPCVADSAVDAGESELPSLFKSYLRAGARVCSLPVIDPKFRCTDWLTVLDMRLLAASFDRRFNRS